MLFGFMILRVKNVILISAAVAIFDLLPLIGVGTILVPWSIAELLLGNTGVGIGLIVLLVLHEIIRQFAEPKIIGKTFGLHPIISLLLLYIGYSALGFIGILIVPFIAVILNAFFDKKDSAKIG
jgi:predicted PurR-regulated permease PerM